MRERAGQGSAPAPNNIYTVLAFVALVSLVAGIVFVCYRSLQLFGEIKLF
jgi:hypothetical protein